MKRSPLLRKTPLRARSKKMAKLYRDERVPLVVRMLEAQPWCQLQIDGVCWRRATCLHEVVKRSAGGSITDPANCMSSCRPCNFWVEDHPTKARELGLSRRA